MSEDEIRAWLGIERAWPPLRPSLVRGMADVPVPVTDANQVEAFRAFLRVAGPLDARRRT